MHYREQLKIIQALQIPTETDTRMDCPFCYHPNSFIINNTTGKLSWYCFHASCEAKGAFQQEKTMDDIKAFLSLKKPKKDFTTILLFVELELLKRLLILLKVLLLIM